MKFFKKVFKKKSALLFSGFALSTFLVNLHQSEVKSYPNTVEECSGSIPSYGNKCLVNPTSFRLDIHGVYICRSDPFPASSIKASLDSCMTLYETNNEPFPGEFANTLDFKQSTKVKTFILLRKKKIIYLPNNS